MQSSFPSTGGASQVRRSEGAADESRGVPFPESTSALLQSLAAWCGRFLGLRFARSGGRRTSLGLRLRRLRAQIFSRERDRLRGLIIFSSKYDYPPIGSSRQAMAAMAQAAIKMIAIRISCFKATRFRSQYIFAGSSKFPSLVLRSNPTLSWILAFVEKSAVASTLPALKGWRARRKVDTPGPSGTP